MIRQVQKIRIYPRGEQQLQLAKAMGCCRFWWNYALNKTIETYKETGKSLSRSALNALLPNLKKEFPWLKTNIYSQSLQQTSLNLSRAFINFFEKRAKFPRFKSKHRKQSVGFPQSVKVEGNYIKIPKIGLVKAVSYSVLLCRSEFAINRALFDRRYAGKIKTVTVTKDSSNRYFASIIYELEACFLKGKSDKILGIDLGIKDFAIVNDGSKTSKYKNPKHFQKHCANLARKQKKLSRKKLGSNSRNKAEKLVAKIHARISNSRQDYLHKLSRKLTQKSQVIVVENLNVKGMVRNHKLAKAISDSGWGMFVNFLSYKLEREEKQLIEIDRWFASSKICSNCLYQIDKMPLDIREWKCPNCNKKHDRDENAAKNIRAEGIRILQSEGTPDSASGGSVRPRRGRKTKALATADEPGNPIL